MPRDRTGGDVFDRGAGQAAPRNRADRRRRQAQWRRSMREFHRHCAGLFNAFIVRSIADEKPVVAQAILDWAKTVLFAGKRPICADCDNEFSRHFRPGAYLIVTAGHDDAARMLISGTCPACAQRSDKALLVSTYRRLGKIWPDLRVLDPVHMHRHGGRA